MIINKNNGEIALGEIVVKPELSLSEFKKTGFYNFFKPLVSNPPWDSYWFKDIKLKLNKMKYRAGIIILFKDKKIERVSFKFIREDDELPKWDQKTEEQRKIYYDDFLEKTLGIPPYIYFWGKVESFYDPKGCTSGILVSYQKAIGDVSSPI